MKKSVLVIDDDVDMCALLSRFLGKNGYEVDTAHSSSKGIEKFKAGNFDIVICDFRLGEKKRWQGCINRNQTAQSGNDRADHYRVLRYKDCC